MAGWVGGWADAWMGGWADGLMGGWVPVVGFRGPCPPCARPCTGEAPSPRRARGSPPTLATRGAPACRQPRGAYWPSRLPHGRPAALGWRRAGPRMCQDHDPCGPGPRGHISGPWRVPPEKFEPERSSENYMNFQSGCPWPLGAALSLTSWLRFWHHASQDRALASVMATLRALVGPHPKSWNPSGRRITK